MRFQGQCPHGEFGAIGFSKLAENTVQILLDSPFAEMQFVGDLFIQFGLGDQIDNLFFAKTEAEVQYLLLPGGTLPRGNSRAMMAAPRTDPAAAVVAKIGSTPKTTAQLFYCLEVERLRHYAVPPHDTNRLVFWKEFEISKFGTKSLHL